jgi:signal transduction histidine kinase
MIRDIWMNLAYLFQQNGQIDSAFYYSYQALQEFRYAQQTTKTMDAALLLSDLYKGKKQFDSAYTYLSYYTSVKEKSLTNENVKKVQNLAFNETLHQRQLEQERREAQQQYEARLKISGLLAVLIVILLLAVILYRSNKQKQKAKVKIEKAYEELKTTQAQLIQAEKMASLGELTAGIAHEIQNPINFVNNFSEVSVELIDEWKEGFINGDGQEAIAIADNVKENLGKILYHGRRADAIVKGMLQHSRTSSGKKEPTDINALADEYLRLSYHGLRAKDEGFNATLQTNFDESIGRISVGAQDIGRVLLNLFNNAFYAVNEKKKQAGEAYEPKVVVSTKKLKDRVEIVVKDNGNGIPPKVVDKIFQPFFTTKPTGQGTGLGLSLSYDIVKAHGGDLSVKTKEGEYAAFIIELPLYSTASL